MQADVSKQADVDRLFAETKKAFGTVDILVNNAGVYEFAPIEQITEESYRRMFDLNVLGTVLSTQAAVKAMNGSGSIINLSSVASLTPAPNRFAVQRHEGCGRRDYALAGAGTWTAEYPRQFTGSRAGGDRRHTRRRYVGGRIQELRAVAYAAGTRRSAG